MQLSSCFTFLLLLLCAPWSQAECPRFKYAPYWKVTLSSPQLDDGAEGQVLSIACTDDAALADQRIVYNGSSPLFQAINITCLSSGDWSQPIQTSWCSTQQPALRALSQASSQC
jgi:hypothetical protein